MFVKFLQILTLYIRNESLKNNLKKLSRCRYYTEVCSSFDIDEVSIPTPKQTNSNTEKGSAGVISNCLKITTLCAEREGSPIMAAEPSNCQLEFDAGRIIGTSNQIISNLENCEKQNDNIQLCVAPEPNSITSFITNEATDTYWPESIPEETQFFRVKQHYLTRDITQNS